MFLFMELHLLALEGLYTKSYPDKMGCAKAMRENVHFLMTALQKLPQYSAEMTLSTFMVITFELFTP